MIEKEALEMGLDEYINCPKSNAFDFADSTFTRYIEDYVDKYDVDLFRKYLAVGETNSQIYGRNQFKESNNLVYKAMLNTFNHNLISSLFKTSDYPIFYGNLDQEIIEAEVRDTKSYNELPF